MSTFVERMKQAKAARTAELGGMKIIPAPFPKFDNADPNWTLLEKLRHPDGDSIEVDVNDDDALIGVAIKQGPHEICKLALTYIEAGIVIRSLQRARRKVKPRKEIP
jgi:hypothetical protein